MSERTIFLAALERGDPAERAAFLDEACGGDDALRRRVEALLRSHEQAGVLDRPAVEEPATGAADPAEGRPAEPLEAPGGRVGPYKLLEQIGEGGMGLVFVAEQQEPVRRKVA